MAIPVSADYDLLDWNSRAAIAADGSATITDNTSGLLSTWTTAGQLLDGTDYVAFLAQGETLGAGDAVAWASLPVVLPTSYTFEFEVLYSEDMPSTWTNLHDRVFVGVHDRYGYSAGFLLTKKGLLLARDIDDVSPVLLQGSDKYLYDTDGAPQCTVVHAQVDSTTGRISIYMSSSVGAYDSYGGTLWWTYPNLTLTHNVAAKDSADTIDGAVIRVSAPSAASLASDNLPAVTGRSTVVMLYSFRVSSLLLTPAERPIAVIEGNKQVSIAQPFRLSGLASSDKYSQELSYDWSIELAPTGSTAKLQGASYAQATTVLGGIATSADVVIFSKRTSSLDNLYSLALVNSGAFNQLLSLTFAGGVLTVSLATDGAGVATTTAADLYTVFRNALSSAYNADISSQFTCELALAGEDGGGVMPTGTFLFSGGTGSALATPLFIPDLSGAYTFSLRVSKPALGGGVQVSAKVLFTTSAAVTDELFNYRPSSEYIYKYLPDFWKLVRGKEQLTSAWSAITQAISADMVMAWQHDYSKSVRDLSRKFQRRWLSFDTTIAAPSGGSIFTPTMENNAAKDVYMNFFSPPITGYTVKEGWAVVTSPVAPLYVGRVLYRASGEEPRVVSVGKVYFFDSKWHVALTTSDFTILHQLDSGTAGIMDQVTPTMLFKDAYHRFFDVSFSDYLRATLASGVDLGAITSIGSDEIIQVSGLFQASTLDQVNYFPWEYLRYIENTRLTVTPFFLFPAGSDLVALDIERGDLCKVIIPNPYDVTEITVYLPILAFDSISVFVDWTLAINALEAAAASAQELDQYPAESLGATGAFIEAFVRTRRSAIRTDLVSVPRVGKTTIASEFTENLDYLVVDERVQFIDTITGTINTTAEGDHPVVASASYWNDWNAETTFKTLQEQGTTSLYLTTGADAGVYTIIGVSPTGAYITDNKQAYTDTVAFRLPRYNVATLPPARHWAEVAYFDNWRTIQNNFGLMVGLPKYILDTYNEDVDYLSAVKSICFAFMSGPSMDNLALMAEGLAGLPFTEHRGQVTEIIDPTSARDGTIIYRDEFGRDISYRYPYGASLAVNPTTNRTITHYPLVAKADIPSVGAPFEAYSDSRLPAYSRLFDIVQVEDYISDPAAIALALPGQEILKKYHTFVVDVPVDITKTTASIPLIKLYMQEAKAAYTNFIIYGSYHITDDLVAEDFLTMVVSLMLRDTPHTMALSWNGTDHVVNTALTKSLLYPNDGAQTKVFADGGATTVSDVVERYESGYQEGVLDDYSGDGSNNAAHQEIDQVNQVGFGDIDVLASRVWIPVEITTTADTEFIIGEELYLANGGVEIVDSGSMDYVWTESPPILLHIGSGVHPKVPFAVWSPQQAHRFTYLILGFCRPQTLDIDPVTGALYPDPVVKTNFACENRLNGLALGNAIGPVPPGQLSIRGKTSQAIAEPLVIPDLTVGANAKYFLLEHVNDADKLEGNNPKDDVTLTVTAYIPIAGMTLQNFHSLAAPASRPSFDPANATASYALLADKYQKQLQMYPYDPAVLSAWQFVPSFGPGIYTSWAGTNPAVDLVKYGYTDVGPLPLTPTAINAFTVGAETALKNIHVGVTIRQHGEWHLTHGFLGHATPGPSSWGFNNPLPGFDIRIEGNYFIDVDPTMPLSPAAPPTASTFAGTIGGCWVFFRNSLGIETPVANVLGNLVFETGLVGAGVTVLGISGAVQTSTGHVLNCILPALAVGTYDVIVRNYRPYQFKSTGAIRLDIQESILSNGVTVL